MQTPTKKPAARKMRTGYGLHADRLSFSHRPAIRSIKFPLVVKDKEVFDDFCNKIRHDYINCVGDINFADWYENKFENKQPTYSVLDFWLDSLRAGVVFFEKPDAARVYLLREVEGFDQRKAFISFFGADTRFEKFDLERVYDECFDTTGLRKTGGRDLFEKLLGKIVKKEFRDKLAEHDRRFLRELALKNTRSRPVPERELFWETKQWKKMSSDYNATFIISPHIKFQKDASVVALLERALLEWRDVETVKDRWGISEQRNAFDRYFREFLPLFSETAGQIEQLILMAIPEWERDKAGLRQRIGFLSAQAKKIANPQLTNHWGDYRNFFGGKIESWVSNYLRQKMDITGKGKINQKTKEPEKGEITLHQEDIKKALAKGWIADKPALVSVLKNLRGVLGGVYNSDSDEISNSALEVYRKELGEARSALNKTYQEQFPDTGDDETGTESKQNKGKRANTDLTHLFRDIKQLPEFVGDAKKRRFGQFFAAPKMLRACLEKLSAFEKARLAWKARAFKRDDVELAKRTLERLRVKHYGRGYGKSKRGTPWHDSGFSGTRFRDVVGAFFVRLKLADALKQPRPLFKSRFARNREPIFSGNEIFNQLDEGQSGQILTAFVNECTPRWQDIRNKYDLTDALWLEKVRIGVILALAGQDSFSLSDIGGLSKEERRRLTELDVFLSLLKRETFTRDEFGRMLQGYIFAPAVGAVMQLSRETYLERYCVLPINTEQHYPLCYHLAEKGRKEWGILLDKKTIQKKRDGNKKEGVGLFLKKKDAKDFANEKQYEFTHLSDDEHFARFFTSPYQMQFINKALGGAESWYAKRKLAADLSSYSFIVEEPVKLDWNIANGAIFLKRSGEKRLIVSIPFNLQAAGKIDALAMGRAVRNRMIMGIDVGEYGVAYVILDCDRNKNNRSVSVHTRGFIEEPLIHTIRGFIGTLKNRQARGTFGMPSTKLARIRENAITSLRNQIHDVALRYNAEPVYEFSITNFETGSGRISKIYKSVKAADVGGNTDADKAQVSLVWGNRARWFGAHVGSYATSYICMRCGYTPYEAHKGDSNSERELLNEERKKARPSLEQFLKMPESKDFDRQRLELFSKQRGNSAIYVCPECRHVSDADIQAAYWIGLKKLWREKGSANPDIQQFVDFHKQLKIKPISLSEA